MNAFTNKLRNLHLLVEFTLNVDVARLLNSEVANE